jgi:hypothetical protein
MRFIFLLAALLIQPLTAENIEDSLERLLMETQKVPSKENVFRLANEIKNNRRHESLLMPGAVAMTNRASLELCEIPGYTRYFADEIESERQKIQMLPPKDGRRNSYNRRRYEIIRLILVELPGPESVAMLGHYLNDDRDPEPPASPSQDYNSPRPSSELASEALAHIGLRNHPVTKKDFMFVDAIVRNRAWWEDVKSGKRSFSFIGQNVEYRFKPDGTWETIAMADPPTTLRQARGRSDGSTVETTAVSTRGGETGAGSESVGMDRRCGDRRAGRRFLGWEAEEKTGPPLYLTSPPT